jgi:hypothetical protein
MAPSLGRIPGVLLSDHHDLSGVVIENLTAAIRDDDHMLEADAGDPMLPF